MAKDEGNESVTNCDKLKIPSSDGKWYFTDVADTDRQRMGLIDYFRFGV